MFSYHRKKKEKTCRADFGGQMRGDKKRPFNGATSYGRLWRKGAGKRAVPVMADFGGRVPENVL